VEQRALARPVNAPTLGGRKARRPSGVRAHCSKPRNGRLANRSRTRRCPLEPLLGLRRCRAPAFDPLWIEAAVLPDVVVLDAFSSVGLCLVSPALGGGFDVSPLDVEIHSRIVIVRGRSSGLGASVTER
jgi:hypothetical protein